MRIYVLWASAALSLLASTGAANAQSNVLAPLQPAPQRKPAPAFALRDAAGKVADLKQYRGKVVLLDFWATWCTGCKQEIPWFVEFGRKFGAKRFAVVGVSLDEGGWQVLKPYLAKNQIPYRMLLGDDATAHRYGIQSLPDTFLIDRQGRVAAAYLASLVDKKDVERNIQALLSNQ
jgi:peroxiredoxin